MTADPSLTTIILVHFWNLVHFPTKNYAVAFPCAEFDEVFLKI
jgi:hypothetical protein